MARKSPRREDMGSFTPAIVKGLLVGLVLVIISLPGLFALHGALRLGSPPISGLVLLGGSVALTLAVANVVGAMMGQARSNVGLAALAGLGIGIASCVVMAPLYGGMVMDGLTHDATSLAWSERDSIWNGTRDAVSGGARDTASEAWSAARERRLQAELEKWRAEARSATTPQAQQNAEKRVRGVAAQLAFKGVGVVKSSVARLSAFALLLWVIVAPPIGAALECRRARR